ncbi:MAG: hypothetical protein LBS01_07525 [Prevotellaceae bacterium]|jgi:hypothetical protein|nr:hypothetical protein [Prevotellaceae bacterium]
MKKIIIISCCCSLLFTTNAVFSQTAEQLKIAAAEKFANEDYSSAIDLLENALKKDTTDKEIYYYLGHYNHYRAYDSRSYDFNNQYSNQIYYYLDKALELDTNYGNARYFYGTQCGADASYSLQHKDTLTARSFYVMAENKKCFTPWLLEYGANVLNSCENNAILFCNGDAEANTMAYLQLIKKVRTDVTVIPLAHLDRIWYVLYLKNGLGRFIKKTDINLSDNQILDLHLFKWKENKIEIALNKDYKEKYHLKENFFIDIAPDIVSVSNSERTYISIYMSVLLNIIEANINKRPVLFTNFDVLENYLQRCGLVFKLIPFNTKGTSFEWDFSAIDNLLKKENFENYKTILSTDQPYISPILFRYHYYCWMPLMQHYIDTDNNKKSELLLDFINDNLISGGYFDAKTDSIIKGWLKELNFYRQSDKK